MKILQSFFALFFFSLLPFTAMAEFEEGHEYRVLYNQPPVEKDAPLEVVEAEKLIPAMRKKAEQLLTAEQAARALKAIEAARLKTGGGFFVNRDGLIRTLLLFALAGGLWYWRRRKRKKAKR